MICRNTKNYEPKEFLFVAGFHMSNIIGFGKDFTSDALHDRTLCLSGLGPSHGYIAALNFFKLFFVF